MRRARRPPPRLRLDCRSSATSFVLLRAPADRFPESQPEGERPGLTLCAETWREKMPGGSDVRKVFEEQVMAKNWDSAIPHLNGLNMEEMLLALVTVPPG